MGNIHFVHEPGAVRCLLVEVLLDFLVKRFGFAPVLLVYEVFKRAHDDFLALFRCRLHGEHFVQQRVDLLFVVGHLRDLQFEVVAVVQWKQPLSFPRVDRGQNPVKLSFPKPLHVLVFRPGLDDSLDDGVNDDAN